MEVVDWLRRAIEDADARGLPQLKPLLESLARSTEALRAAERAERADQAAAESTEQAEGNGRD